jgi:hypothetical protein
MPPDNNAAAADNSPLSLPASLPVLLLLAKGEMVSTAD